MPRSPGVAVRVARSAAGCVPALLAALLLAAPTPAGAITAIQVVSTLIAQVGRPFDFSFTPINSHLPKYAVDWSLSPGSCLAGSGIALDGSTGTLSGTPGAPGTFQCVIVAVDTYPDPLTAAQRAFTLLIEPAPQCVEPSVGGGAPPPATVGVPYAFTVVTSGSPAPTLSVDGLPAGLAFDAASGLVSGTPEAAGTSTLTFTATNGCIAPAVQSLTLTVDRVATTLALTVLPDIAVFGQTISATLVASGGLTPPQGAVALCVRGTGMFCGPPFDTVPPGTPPEKIAAPLTGVLEPGGRLEFLLTGLTIDAFTLSGVYAGDSTHMPASAGPAGVLVIKGVLLPAPPNGTANITATFGPSADPRAIPALSSIGLLLLAVAVAALATAALRRRARR